MDQKIKTWIHTVRDTKTNKHLDRQKTNMQTDKHTGKQIDIQRNKQVDKYTYRHIDRV